MQKIDKGDEPECFTRWKSQHPGARYRDIKERQGEVKRAIRLACRSEQRGLCAFCCRPIGLDNSHNAHLESQDMHSELSLNWDNIVASCDSRNSCGKSQGNNSLPLSPLMEECEHELVFYQSGSVKGLAERAKEAIRILNLDCDELRSRRKKAIRDFLYGTEC